MKIRRGLSIIAFAISIIACAHVHDSADIQGSLMTADRAFYAASRDQGVEGFRSFLADDAVAVEDAAGTQSGDKIAAAWKPLLESKGQAISWDPVSAGVIQSAQLGWTTGRFMIKDKSDGAVLRSGTYTTVWKWSGGRWLVVLDGGCLACARCLP